MNDFPEFMKGEKNRITSGQQNTPDVEGYYYEGNDGGQMAFWTCFEARESKKHRHGFDEYMIVVSGEYTLCTGKGETVLRPGDEALIPGEQSSGAGALPGRERYTLSAGRG